MENEWRETTLGALLLFSNGRLSPDRLDQFSHPVYGSNGIIGFSEEINSDPNTIIVGRVGSYCGSLHYSERSCWVTDNAIRANPIERNNAKFLYYLLQTLRLNDRQTGSGQPLLNQTVLSSVPVIVPPPAEQHAIAHVLGTLDDKIELNRRMNETLEKMARALFKSWFVDFDPVRAKMEGRDPALPKHIADLFPDRLVESALGEIPEGWQVKLFGDIINRLGGNINPLTCPDTVFSHFSIPAYDKGQLPKQELGTEIKSTKTRVPSGAILLSKLNPEIERVWLVDVMDDEAAICSTEFLVLQGRTPIQRSYIYCLACNSFFREQIKSLVTGTSKSHQRAPASAITKLEVVFPPGSIAQMFESRASELFNRGLSCRREIKTLSALRDALLPRLISGEIRLREAEKVMQGVM